MQTYLSLLQVVGVALSFFGFVICLKWYIFWRRHFKGELITHGLYSRVRHPFYSGFLVFVVGFLIYYLSIEAIMLAIISFSGIFFFIPREEASLIEKYGRSYLEYMNKVPWKIIPGIY